MYLGILSPLLRVLCQLPTNITISAYDVWANELYNTGRLEYL